MHSKTLIHSSCSSFEATRGQSGWRHLTGLWVTDRGKFSRCLWCHKQVTRECDSRSIVENSAKVIKFRRKIVKKCTRVGGDQIIIIFGKFWALVSTKKWSWKLCLRQPWHRIVDCSQLFRSLRFHFLPSAPALFPSPRVQIWSAVPSLLVHGERKGVPRHRICVCSLWVDSILSFISRRELALIFLCACVPIMSVAIGDSHCYFQIATEKSDFCCEFVIKLGGFNYWKSSPSNSFYSGMFIIWNDYWFVPVLDAFFMLGFLG